MILPLRYEPADMLKGMETDEMLAMIFVSD